MCYDIDRFVDHALASKLVCSICQGVLCCPQINKSSPISKQESANGKKGGHKYCINCIKDWLNKEKSCPECRERLNMNDLQDLDRFSCEILKELKIRCKYFSKGCKFSDKLELIERHELNNCPFAPKECKACGTQVPNSTIHSDKDCINRLIKIIKIKDDEIQQRDATMQMLNIDFEDELKLKDEKIIKLENEMNKLNNKIKESKENNGNDIKKTVPKGLFKPQTVVDIPELVDICASEENPIDRVKAIVEIQNANVNITRKSYKEIYENVQRLKSHHSNKRTLTSFLDIERIGELDHDWIGENNSKIGYTPLIAASEMGHSNVVEFLIQKGADVNLISNDGYNALILATNYGHLNIVKLLTQNGANVNYIVKSSVAKENYFGNACEFALSNKNLNWTALIYATASGYLEIVKVLVENGAQVNYKDSNNNTALGYAKSEDIRKYLTSLGAV